MNNACPVQEVIEPQFVIEGAGVLLRRSITPKVSNRFDPFLFLIILPSMTLPKVQFVGFRCILIAA
jgi:hypothetical protein